MVILALKSYYFIVMSHSNLKNKSESIIFLEVL